MLYLGVSEWMDGEADFVIIQIFEAKIPQVFQAARDFDFAT